MDLSTMNTENEKKPLLDRIFPLRYDFDKMLHDQAVVTAEGIETLEAWLEEAKLSDPKELIEREDDADKIRHDLEHKLMEAFSTPFDRQNIYAISHQMDLILDFALSTALEMRAFGVYPDDAIRRMTGALLRGVRLVADALKIMVGHPERVDAMIRDMRAAEHEIEKVYVQSMSVLLQGRDAFEALKKREIYHHLKDAGRNLGGTVDTLHRIIVSLA
jgi:uncharacterized protein Yka (UPF0111/DUF47 family)